MQHGTWDCHKTYNISTSTLSSSLTSSLFSILSFPCSSLVFPMSSTHYSCIFCTTGISMCVVIPWVMIYYWIWGWILLLSSIWLWLLYKGIPGIYEVANLWLHMKYLNILSRQFVDQKADFVHIGIDLGADTISFKLVDPHYCCLVSLVSKYSKLKLTKLTNYLLWKLGNIRTESVPQQI